MEENLSTLRWADGSATHSPPAAVDPNMSVAEAMELLRRSPGESLPILRPGTGEVLGLLSRPQSPAPQVSPPRLGGMATPLGVYLTDGVYAGGAGFFGLALTGMILGGAELGAQALIQTASRLWGATPPALPFGLHLPALQNWLWQMESGLGPVLLVMALLFTLLRLMPMSGTHAAEHQVVHCIERGLPLLPSCVRAMPRVHPRCGTNLVVGFSLFQLIFLAVWTALQASFGALDAASLAVLAAAPVSLIYWRRLGGWVQQWLTTRPATDRQIQGAIRAAEQVLHRRREAEGVTVPRFRLGRRIWRMGMPQVLLGYAAVYGLLTLLAHFWPRFGDVLGV